MPSFLGYIEKYGALPKRLSFSLAALIAFYSGDEIREKALIGHRGPEEYQILDDEAVLQFFAENSRNSSNVLVSSFLGQERFWGQNLTEIEGLVPTVSAMLEDIRQLGVRAALEKQCRD